MPCWTRQVTACRDRSRPTPNVSPNKFESAFSTDRAANGDKKGISRCAPRIMTAMEFHHERHIGDILKERNIEIVGADLATRHGFTQVPNFILTKQEISVGAKLAYAMLLKYAWANDACFPGQITLAEDMGAA